MKNERIEKRKQQHKEKGISTFLMILVTAFAVLIVGFIISRVANRLFNISGEDVGLLPVIILLISSCQLAILMVFFYFNLRSLKSLKKAAEAAEAGEGIDDTDAGGDVADLINVIGRVSSRMAIGDRKTAKTVDDYQSFIPRGILEYCHVDIHKELTPGIIGTVKGTRATIILGNYKAGSDPKEYSNLIARIMGRGGRMLSCTSEIISAFFPGTKEEDVRFIEAELKDGQILNVHYGTYDIIATGSRTSMFVRAREHVY